MDEANRVELEIIERRLRSIAPRSVLLQLPSGLKPRAMELAHEIRSRFGCEVMVSGDSCYGACDIPLDALDTVDAVIQVGHEPMPAIRCSKPLLFVPFRIDILLEELIDSAIEILRPPIGLLATAQHLHQIQDVKRLLEGRGIEVLIGQGSGRLTSAGHILGCDFSAARAVGNEVSSFLLLGGGRFHAVGVSLATGKPVVILDPERSSAVIEEVDLERFMRRRHSVIQQLSEARSIGVIVSTKPGQMRLGLARRLCELVDSSGREGVLILMDEISSDRLVDLRLEAYVSTACPRLALDDVDRFESPVGTPIELMISLGKGDWKNYVLDDLSTESPDREGLEE